MMKPFIALISCSLAFISLLAAQDTERRPVQKWMAGAAFSGIVGRGDTSFYSAAVMPQIGIRLGSRFSTGVSAQFFRRYAEGFPRATTGQAGPFLRWYPATGDRWAFSTELAWLFGNHYDTRWTFEGPQRRSGQQAIQLGLNGELRLFGPVWVEASFVFNRSGSTDFNNFLSIGLNTHLKQVEKI